jgi:tetratricopeptide (TPR) repeat protein
MTVEPLPASGPVPSADDSAVALDDPYQCPFCGQLTDAADRRCGHCGRGLLVVTRATLQSGAYLQAAVFLVSVLAAVALLEALPPLFTWQVAQGVDAGPFELLARTPGVDYLLGRFLDWPEPVARVLLAVAAGRAAVLAAAAAGLRWRSAPAYYLALGALVLDALWNIYRLAGGYTGPVGVVVNLALGLAALVTLFASDRDFAVVRRRILVRPDGGLHDAVAYYKRGHEYRRAGMWALAVAHWRMAVARQPREAQYYKDLAAGYAQIGRFERSLVALAEAARQAPHDAEIAEMEALVRRKQGGDA